MSNNNFEVNLRFRDGNFFVPKKLLKNKMFIIKAQI